MEFKMLKRVCEGRDRRLTENPEKISAKEFAGVYRDLNCKYRNEPFKFVAAIFSKLSKDYRLSKDEISRLNPALGMLSHMIDNIT